MVVIILGAEKTGPDKLKMQPTADTRSGEHGQQHHKESPIVAQIFFVAIITTSQSPKHKRCKTTHVFSELVIKRFNKNYLTYEISVDIRIFFFPIIYHLADILCRLIIFSKGFAWKVNSNIYRCKTSTCIDELVNQHWLS